MERIGISAASLGEIDTLVGPPLANQRAQLDGYE